MTVMSANVVMKLVGCPGSGPTPFDGQYLREYDPTQPGATPDGEPLIAHLVTTSEKDKAKVFPTLAEALETWRLVHGVRPDGEPNRPLTAFTVTFE